MRSPEMAPVRTPEPDELQEMFDTPSVSDQDRQENSTRNNETTEDTNTDETEHSADTASESSDFYSTTAERVARASATMVAVLEKLSAGAPARQEARAEKMENAKNTVKQIGSRALRSAKQFGSPSFSENMLATIEVTNGILTTSIVRKQIMVIARKAQVRYAERAAYREEGRRNRDAQDDVFASYEPNVQYSQDHTEALDINAQKKADQEYAEMSYGPNVRYSQDHAEAVQMNDEKKANQEAAYDTYSDNIDTTERRENQEAAFDSYDGNVKYSEALERKRMALAHKEARKARRQEIYGKTRDKSGELYGRAKAGAKRFGRAALKMIKRTAAAGRAAASAAVGAGKEAWAQSA